MKIALVKVVDTNPDDDYSRSSLVAESITEWFEVTDKELAALNRFKPYEIKIIEQFDKFTFSSLLEECMKKNDKYEEERAKQENARLKREETRLKNKQKRDEAKKLKQLEALKKELGVK